MNGPVYGLQHQSHESTEKTQQRSLDTADGAARSMAILAFAL